MNYLDKCVDLATVAVLLLFQLIRICKRCISLKKLKGNKGVKPHVLECIAATCRSVQVNKKSFRKTTTSFSLELELFVFLRGLPTVCGFFTFLQRM